jgi:hypothetical protein
MKFETKITARWEGHRIKRKKKSESNDVSRDDGESDSSLGVLEQSDGFLVSFAVEQRRINGVDLIARPQIRLGGRSALKDSLDEDGKVTLRIAQSTDDAETQTVGSSFQDDARKCWRSCG